MIKTNKEQMIRVNVEVSPYIEKHNTRPSGYHVYKIGIGDLQGWSVEKGTKLIGMEWARLRRLLETAAKKTGKTFVVIERVDV